MSSLPSPGRRQNSKKVYFLRSWDPATLMYSSITNEMQRYTMVFITINDPHVSGGSSVHHQELKTVYRASGICRAFTVSYRLLTQAVRSGGVMVKALCYKSAGRGFDSRGVIGIFQWHNPSGRTMALGSNQPLIEMSTRCISWG